MNAWMGVPSAQHEYFSEIFRFIGAKQTEIIGREEPNAWSRTAAILHAGHMGYAMRRIGNPNGCG